MAEWMEDNHVLAEISKSLRNPFLPSSNRFPIPSEIQEDGLSGKKPKFDPGINTYVHVLILVDLNSTQMSRKETFIRWSGL